MICDTDRSPSSDCSLTDFVVKKVNLTYSNWKKYDGVINFFVIIFSSSAASKTRLLCLFENLTKFNLVAFVRAEF